MAEGGRLLVSNAARRRRRTAGVNFRVHDFEVYAIHFLLGEALQEAEVFYRNDSGQVLPTGETMVRSLP